MNLEKYQRFTRTTAIYPQYKAIEYLALGLASEGGEVAGVTKKWVRGDYTTEVMKTRLKDELGDVIWYIARLSDEIGLSLEEIILHNQEKLTTRQINNQLRGDGDGDDRITP
jgi:NTP pyrophosphatase (non-canonical NTP hydrolase)